MYNRQRAEVEEVELFDQVLDDAAIDDETTRYVFLTARGYLTGNLIASNISATPHDAIQRTMLVAGMAAAVRERHDDLPRL
ncbi:MAG TPA: hypothetical protein VHZ02_07750 [Acidimicrobiales bacterium]|jgi:hypothetical protein|nr:hypothetical protein [Acidimicrobiales bacterium]